MGNIKPHSKIYTIFADEEYEYRIPALIYLDKGTTGVFLAFAEKRSTSKDEHAKNLVLKTGQWQPDNTLKWSDTQDLMKATKDGYRTMNPCPVFKKETETLHLFFICLKGKINENNLKKSQSHLCYITSKDYGETWDEIQDITDVIDSRFSDYQTFAVGPGHGIQLSTGPLLVPAYVKMKHCCKQCGSCWCCWWHCCKIKSHSLVLRSSDGETWEACDPVSEESGECQLVEVSGEGVYLNARTTGKLRVEALSKDDGEHFELLNSELKERGNGCHGSVLGFTAGKGGSSETSLLFSHPTKVEGWKRENLGIYMRKSFQDDWGKAHIILEGSSGYSDLTACDKQGCSFACLMETRDKRGRHQIVFKQFNLGQSGCPREELEVC